MKKVSAVAGLPLMLLLSLCTLAGAALYEAGPARPAPAAARAGTCPVPQGDATETVWEAFSRRAVSAFLFR